MKFKSKSLISIILSIMMVISMIIVAIPANAAVIDSEPVGAGSYYIWYNKTKDSNIPSSYDGGPIPMSEEDGKQVGYFTSAAGRNVYFLINQSDKDATTNNIWTKEPKVNISSDFNWANGRYGGYGGSNYGLVETYVKNGVSANIKVVFDPVTNTVDLSVVSDIPSTPQPTTTPTPTTQYYIGGRFKTSTTDTFTGAGYEWNADSENVPFVETETTGIYKVETGLTVADLSGQTSGKQDYFFLITAKSGTTTSYYGDSNKSGTYHNFQKYINSSSSASLGIVSGDDAKRLIKFNDPSATTGLVTIFLDTNGGMKLWYTTDGTSTRGDFNIIDKTAANGKLTFSAPNKAAGTADAGNTVTITGTPLNSYYELSNVSVSYKVGKTEVPLVASKTDGKFTFDIPSDLDYTTVKDATISVKGTFTLTSSGKLDYVKAKGSGLYIDVAPAQNDTTATLIKWNNYKGKDHGTSNPYTFYVPKNVDLANAVIYNTTGSQITLGGKTINNNEIAEGVSLKVGDNTITGGSVNNVKVMQGSTDAMFLNTTKEDGTDFDLPTKRRWTYDQGITDKQANEYKAEIKSSGGSCTTMDNTSGTAKFSSAMGLDTVKGRGNSSWKASATMFGKFAFNMKLKSKTNLLGMDSAESSGAKSWCLLANNADESMLRNALTYQLASEIGLLYSPEFRFVDIYDNGEYMGSYLVTEKVDVGSSKLVKGESFEDINEEAAGTVVEDAVTGQKYSYGSGQYDMSYAKVTSDGNTASIASKTGGKYLLEFEITERYTDETSWFTSPRGQHVVVKNPEFATKEQVTYIAQKFAAMEEIAFTTGATKAQLSTVMDVESFAKMYLIQEFSSNLDAASTSYYLTFDCSKNDANGNGAVFVANPVWDYDWAYGQYENTTKKGKVGDTEYTLNTEEAGTVNDGQNYWVAKYKYFDDSKGNNGKQYSIQSQLASQNSYFKAEIRKQWEGLNGFYETIKNYYGNNSKIDAWYNQIKDSVNMNETRWGFIQSNPIKSWGSTNTGDTHEAAVNYLETKWTAARATWLNTQFINDSEYAPYTPSKPTIAAYNADQSAEITEVNSGTDFVIKVTSDIESGVKYRLYEGSSTEYLQNSDGVFTLNVTEAGYKTYRVKAVYGTTESEISNSVTVKVNSVPVAITGVSISTPKTTVNVDEEFTLTATASPSGLTGVTYTFYKDGKAIPEATDIEYNTFTTTITSAGSAMYKVVATLNGKPVESDLVTVTAKTASVTQDVTIYFKTATAPAYAPSVSFDDGNATAMTKSSDLGKDYSGALTFAWYSVEIQNVDTTKTHTLTFTSKRTKLNATWNGTLTKDSYFTADNLMNGTVAVNLTDKGEAERNFFYSATNMVYDSTDAKNKTLGFTFVGGSRVKMGTKVSESNGTVTPVSAPTVKSATYIQMVNASMITVSSLQSELYDVNFDGKVDIKDATYIQYALAS